MTESGSSPTPPRSGATDVGSPGAGPAGAATNDAGTGDGATGDVTRHTRLDAERTWLAWWRTGFAAAALAIAVGRILPVVAHGARWPFTMLGMAYGLLAVGVLVLGPVRQQRTADALRRGSYAALSSQLVMWLTAIAVGLSVAGVALIAVRL